MAGEREGIAGREKVFSFLGNLESETKGGEESEELLLKCD